MNDFITVDGAQGEGGGQILRTALALSLVTGRPFRIERIRAGRRKPGLLRQHLTAALSAADVGHARVTGAELGSQTLSFTPARVHPGEYRFAVGTAGSATLVLQTVLPALLRASGPSRLTLEGGTHNPAAPPFDFVAQTFLPVLRRMGASVEASLDTYGFYPAGGGRFTVNVQPCDALAPLSLVHRGVVELRARALVAALPEKIGTRELGVVRQRLELGRERCRVLSVDGAIGPGNVLMIAIASDEVTEIVTGFGEKGVTSEEVAAAACDEVEEYLKAGVPVGRHLADQLLIPLAMAGGGRFRTPTPTPHTLTNADVIRRFLDVDIRIRQESDAVAVVSVGE